jgi:LemA protein
VTAVELAAAFAVGLLVAIAGYLAFATYNAVVALRYRIDKAWSNIDVALKQRFDQLPNLVEAVRGLMAWEQAVLVEVTEARAAYSPTAPIPEQAATSAATSSAIRSLFATVERYPKVRSAANVMALQEEIERLEAMIADRRELYNDQVYLYNTRIAQVPAVLLATLFGWRARPFFAASDAERARPSAGLGTGEAEAGAGAGAEADAGGEVPRG